MCFKTLDKIEFIRTRKKMRTFVNFQCAAFDALLLSRLCVILFTARARKYFIVQSFKKYAIT